MKKERSSFLLRLLVRGGALFTMSVLILLVLFIVVQGVGALKPSLFAWKYNSENVSLTPALINTLLMTLLALIFALPPGLGAAVYLAEYAHRGSRFIRLVRLGAETLAGIPSIIYGLFGMLSFVTACRMGVSILSGALTLSLMILPLIMRTAEEALRAVPDSYREASFGLGAGQLRTVFRVILPSAVPGILAGVILSVGRIVGETAALIYTAGTVAEVALHLTDSARTLSVHMYALSSEGLYMKEASGTALVLLVIAGVLNAVSYALGKRLSHDKI